MITGKITVDRTKAVWKTKAVKSIPTAAGKILVRWGAETVKFIGRYANSVFSKGKNRRTGHLVRNLGMDVKALVDRTEVTVGTGLRGAQPVVYAQIQNRGGTIRKKSKMLTVPMPGVMGRARDYPDAFFIRSKSGAPLLVMRKGEGKGNKLKVLFVLKNEVTLPGSRWFDNPMTYRESILRGYLSPESLLTAAGKEVT